MYLADGRVKKLRRSESFAGNAHELTFSCYQRLPLLSRDRTRQWFLESLDAARQKHEFELWAYVVMPEHVHVLLLPRRPDYRVPVLLQSIKQPVARKAIAFLKQLESTFLKKLETRDSNGKSSFHFWQMGGGYDRNMVNAKTAWQAVEYLHRNPVKRGLVASPTDWVWSSARQYAGMDGVVLEVDSAPPVP